MLFHLMQRHCIQYWFDEATIIGKTQYPENTSLRLLNIYNNSSFRLYDTKIWNSAGRVQSYKDTVPKLSYVEIWHKCTCMIFLCYQWKINVPVWMNPEGYMLHLPNPLERFQQLGCHQLLPQIIATFHYNRQKLPRG